MAEVICERTRLYSEGELLLVHERGMRIDKWLWFSRLSGSRSEAQALCESRRLRLDGRVIERSCATVRPGSVLSFPRGDHVVAVRVSALADRRGPALEARMLYTPLLPSPARPPSYAGSDHGALLPA